MSLCNPHQLRRNGLMLGAALLITSLGAPIPLQSQQLDTSNSSTSSSNASATLASPSPASELPDAPGALLYPQSGQTPTPNPVPQTIPPTPNTTDNPDIVSPNGTQQTKRVLGIVPNFRSVSADIKLPPMSSKDKFIIAGKDTFDYSALFIAGIQAGFAMK